jgi:MFS family permease
MFMVFSTLRGRYRHFLQDFQSFSLQGWVATSFVLAQSRFQRSRRSFIDSVVVAVFLLFYGQLLRIFPAKWILVVAIVTFELGSLVCGVAQNVDQLIAGRTVSGLGAAGICGPNLFFLSLRRD